MYPARELTRLSTRKAEVVSRIRVHRWTCADQFGQVARPFLWLEQMHARWKAISPFAKLAAIPLGLLFKRSVFPKTQLLTSLIRWAPLAIKLFRTAR